MWPHHIHKFYEFYEDGASCEAVAQLNITVSSVARSINKFKEQDVIAAVACHRII